MSLSSAKWRVVGNQRMTFSTVYTILSNVFEEIP